MAFQLGTNWSVLSQMSGPIQGPLLPYEAFSESSFIFRNVADRHLHAAVARHRARKFASDD
jgi:hypothetical protein